MTLAGYWVVTFKFLSVHAQILVPQVFLICGSNLHDYCYRSDINYAP